MAEYTEKVTSKGECAAATTQGGELSDSVYALRRWGDGTGSPLYCPITERINDTLAAEVDEKLAAWMKDCGFDKDEVKKIRKFQFGRLVTLTHPSCDDIDRLLIGAKMNAAWWLTDDYYVDEVSLGAKAELLPERLMLAMTAMDSVSFSGEFSRSLNEVLASDRILVALRSGLDHMARYATAEQIYRTCYATFAMFVSWNAYAAWKQTNVSPILWKYLAARQYDSFYLSFTLIDVIGGYHLPAELFYSSRVRQAVFQAASAVKLVNDLYSVSKDMADEVSQYNTVLLIAAERGCSIQESIEDVVRLHNDVVRDFEESHRSLLSIHSIELQRFMCGLRGWMGGAFEWHDSNPRYKI